jgi:hypothetical protein
MRKSKNCAVQSTAVSLAKVDVGIREKVKSLNYGIFSTSFCKTISME